MWATKTMPFLKQWRAEACHGTRLDKETNRFLVCGRMATLLEKIVLKFLDKAFCCRINEGDYLTHFSKIIPEKKKA